MFLARAGGKPLSIHVIGSSGSFIICPERHSFTQFLAAIAPRTCGFTWDIPVEVYGNLCLEAIPTFLKGCVPGTLTYFAVNMGPETLVGWQAGHLAMCLDAREDALLLPITALKLHNFHYSWTSKLYRGLTEFRLTGSSGHDSVDDDPRGHRSISASALLAILESSPKLRVIQIGIHIWEDMISLREDAPVTPVLLEDLEVLTLGPDSLGRVTLMKLIQPGRKLLTFSIVNPTQFRGHIEGSGGYIAEEFFARSNVTRLIVSGLYNYIDLWNLLNLIPTVRVLALESVRTCQMIKDEDLPPSPTTLDALYVTRSFNNNFSPHVIWPLIKQVIRRHRIPKLTLWRYASDARIMSDNVYAVCPQVTVVPNTDPDPIQEWK
ncbi:hypothetical protein FRC11_013177 [Ceratobasidium sp. 423]|nr:hypothetical protein FRC11_013177 [Ceratobasidium sp. 423]